MQEAIYECPQTSKELVIDVPRLPEYSECAIIGAYPGQMLSAKF